MNRTVKLFGVCVLLSLLAVWAAAQVATADLHVTVKDGNGAVVSNAKITARNAAQYLERTQNKGVQGEYSVRALPPGHYEITVEAPGFAKTVVKDVAITVG